MRACVRMLIPHSEPSKADNRAQLPVAASSIEHASATLAQHEPNFPPKTQSRWMCKKEKKKKARSNNIWSCVKLPLRNHPSKNTISTRDLTYALNVLIFNVFVAFFSLLLSMFIWCSAYRKSANGLDVTACVNEIELWYNRVERVSHQIDSSLCNESVRAGAKICNGWCVKIYVCMRVRVSMLWCVYVWLSYRRSLLGIGSVWNVMDD